MFNFWIADKKLPHHVQYLKYEEYMNGKWAAHSWKDKKTQVRFRNYNGFDITDIKTLNKTGCKL